MANMKLSNPGALKLIILLILFVAPLIGCQKSDEKVVYDLDFIQSRNILCGVAISSGLNPSGSFLAQNLQPKIEPNHQRYLGAGYDSGLDLVLPNDNLTRSGILKRDLLKLDLEVKWGDFRMETPDRPGVKLVAIGETGKELTIPAPLVRVTSGTTIRARIKNTLRDSTITIYGLQKRPFTAKDSVFVLPGEVGEVVFDAGKPGTYMYWVKLGKGHKRVFGAEEDDQLAGAFIIDPKGSVVNDRVFVMNVFSNKNVDSTAYPEWVDVLTINGRSWPFTERMTPSVGDVLNWRIINASVGPIQCIFMDFISMSWREEKSVILIYSVKIKRNLWLRKPCEATLPWPCNGYLRDQEIGYFIAIFLFTYRLKLGFQEQKI